MVFSDTTTKLGIIQECERYCSMGDGGISGTTLTLQEFTARANKSLREVWHAIFMSYGGWQYDDANQTTLPAGRIDITADQTSYPLPSTALTVRGVEVLNSAGDVWSQLKPITEEQIRERQSMGEFNNTSSTPLYYQMVGTSIRLFPASNYTVTNGFKVFFDRGSVAFASDDTTQAPGFAGEYHDLVPVTASIDYLETKAPTDPTLIHLKNRRLEMKDSLKKFYSKRFHQMFPPRITVRDVSREAM